MLIDSVRKAMEGDRDQASDTMRMSRTFCADGQVLEEEKDSRLPVFVQEPAGVR